MFLCMAILRLHTLCLPLVSQVHPDYFFVFVLHILCMAILRPLTLYFHPIFHFVFVFGYPTPIHPVFTIGFTSSPYLCFLFFLFYNLCTAILRLLTAYFHLFFDLCFVYGFMYIYFPILIAYTFWFCVWLSYVTHSNFTFGFVHIILFSHTLSPRVCTLVLPQTQIWKNQSLGEILITLWPFMDGCLWVSEHNSSPCKVCFKWLFVYIFLSRLFVLFLLFFASLKAFSLIINDYFQTSFSFFFHVHLCHSSSLVRLNVILA